MPTPANASNAYKKQIATIAAGTYNVLHYGATGNGSTDDAAAIQAALDACAAAGGGTVYFPDGTYIVGTDSDNSQTHDAKIKGGLKIGDNTWVRGSGFSTVLKIDAASYVNSTWSKMNIFINDDLVGGNSNIIISDMKLDGNYANVIAAAVEQETIDFVNVTNYIIRDVYITESTNDAIDLDTCDNGLISNILIKNSVTNKANMYNGVHVSGTHVVIQDSYFEYCGDGRKAAADPEHGAINVGSIEYAIVTGNTIVNSSRGINIANLTVDSVFSNNSINTTSRAGISVTNGAVRNLISNNIIMNCNTDSSATDADMWAIYVAASNTTVANNCMNTGSQKKGVKFTTTTQGGTITGNYIAASEQAIHMNCSGSSQITNNKIQGTCTVHAIEADGGACVISGNVIDGRPSNSARGAIDLNTNANMSVVTGNVIKGDTAGMAIHVDADDCSVSGNYTEGTGAASADIYIKGTNCIAYGNRCVEAATAGIRAATTATNVVIYGNNLTGCADGILDDGATNPQISGATGAAANINP